MKFSEFPLREVGHSVLLVGGVWSDGGIDYICIFPEYGGGQAVDRSMHHQRVEMMLDDWNALIRQSDSVETEVLARAQDGGLVKVIVRKCERAIAQDVSWAVFRRDGFRCRYCGADAVPLTVDHLVLWEEGGPSILENLLAACRKCNKLRGRMQYVDWLDSVAYRERSVALTDAVKALNCEVLTTLANIPRLLQKRSR